MTKSITTATTPIVLRITRHDMSPAMVSCLQGIYGKDVTFVTHDIRYGDDPVADLLQLIAEVEGQVVAIAAVAPFPILMKLVGARKSRDESRRVDAPFIRPVWARGENGRVIVDEATREFELSHYEVLEALEIRTSRLGD